jgi:hypothetical protein
MLQLYRYTEFDISRVGDELLRNLVSNDFSLYSVDDPVIHYWRFWVWDGTNIEGPPRHGWNFVWCIVRACAQVSADFVHVIRPLVEPEWEHNFFCC